MLSVGSLYIWLKTWACRNHLLEFIQPRFQVFVSSTVNNVNYTHFFWNMRSLSCLRSVRSMPFPFSMTSGCFLHISHPMWEKKKPLLALWGSALVSLYLWCTLWSRAHSYTWFSKAIVLKITRITRSGHLALYERCAHSLCAPAVMPRPLAWYRRVAETGKRRYWWL